MGPHSCRNFQRIFAVRLAVVTNRVRGLVWSARTILLGQSLLRVVAVESCFFPIELSLILFRQPFLLRDAIPFSLDRAFSLAIAFGLASLRGFAAKLRADRGKGGPSEGRSKQQD